MRVSFVIPTQNHAAFIRRCIDSCLEQDLPDREILVVDGASTDGTQAVLAGYGDRIQWVSEPDEGQAQAVNKGVRAASGEVIAWLNSDDYYAGERPLRQVVRAFEDDGQLDVAYGEARLVRTDGSLLRRYRTRPPGDLATLLVAPIPPAMQPAVFFRRRLFLDCGGLREDLHYAMDYDLWLRMFPRARLVRRLPLLVACATFHLGAKSVAGLQEQVDELIRLKKEHARAARLSMVNRIRLLAGVAELRLYCAAVRLGLRSAT